MSSVSGKFRKQTRIGRLQGRALALEGMLRQYIKAVGVLGQETNWARRDEGADPGWLWVGEGSPIEAVRRALGLPALNKPPAFPEVVESSGMYKESDEPAEKAEEK